MFQKCRRTVSINENQNNEINNIAYKMPDETKDLHKAEILKKIPEGAEAFAVLVGERRRSWLLFHATLMDFTDTVRL